MRLNEEQMEQKLLYFGNVACFRVKWDMRIKMILSIGNDWSMESGLCVTGGWGG